MGYQCSAQLGGSFLSQFYRRALDRYVQVEILPAKNNVAHRTADQKDLVPGRIRKIADAFQQPHRVFINMFYYPIHKFF
jgi:hypothetical protein